jgi:hypothetical protein
MNATVRYEYRCDSLHPMRKPVYAERAVVKRHWYTDPMGVTRVEYTREKCEKKGDAPPPGCIQKDAPPPGCNACPLRDVDAQTSNREELMSLQMQKMYSQHWGSAYSFNSCRG